MDQIQLHLLRGVCQIPAYVAYEKKFFLDEGVDAQVSVAPTAWAVPEKLNTEELCFAVIPWTRVAAASSRGEPLVLLSGSGCEEAAIVVRNGVEVKEVRKVAVPQRGGIKDLTAEAMMESLGWEEVETIRQPSGDGAILALVGQGADAASMVEPYATMMEKLEIGRIVRNTGDMWPGAPGCSLTTNARSIEEKPEVVGRVVTAFYRGSRFAETNPEEAADIASSYIGVSSRFIQQALQRNAPNIDALKNTESMDAILDLMLRLKYIDRRPNGFVNLNFLEKAKAAQLD